MRGLFPQERAKRTCYEVVLCDEISHALESMILARGIEIVQRVTGNVDEVLDTYREQKRHDHRLFHKPTSSVRQLNEGPSNHA